VLALRAPVTTVVERWVHGGVAAALMPHSHE